MKLQHVAWPRIVLATSLLAVGCAGAARQDSPAIATSHKAEEVVAPTHDAADQNDDRPRVKHALPTTPPTFMAPNIAPPAKDALMAADRSLPVVIPTADQSARDGVELPALRAAIEGQMVAAKKRHAKAKPPLNVVYVDTTVDYGCLCPPYVLAPFYNMGEGGYVWPKFAKTTIAAPVIKGGLLRFAGHFEATARTGYQAFGTPAQKRPGVKSDEETGEPDPMLEIAPVFVVEGWCFEPSDSMSSSQFEIYRDLLVELATGGRFCPGTTFPEITSD